MTVEQGDAELRFETAKSLGYRGLSQVRRSRRRADTAEAYDRGERLEVPKIEPTRFHGKRLA